LKSPRNFIVKPKGDRYNHTDGNIIVSVTEEDHTATNREAIVVSTPNNYTGPISVGDTLLVHHNVFKIQQGWHGERRNSGSFLREGLFMVDTDQFFLYKKDKWYSHDRYCFVAPIEADNTDIYKGCKYEPLHGVMRYPNDYLLSQGVKEGDKVCFKPNSEYEFTVDGELLYRVLDHQITIKYD
jgi:hypothetical protein